MTATATDSAAFRGTSSSFTWTVHDVVTVTNPGTQTSTSGTAISTLTPSASIVGGGTVSSWAQTGMPPGLSFNTSTGAFTGTPTTGRAAPYSVTITATDSRGDSGSATFNWTVNNTVTVTNPGAQTKNSGTAIATLTLSAATSGAAGGATISTSGWSVTAGSLPPGLSLSTAGAITGTPTTAGSYSATVQATDSAGFTGTTVVSYTINNVVTVTNPGAQTKNSGTAIATLTLSASTSSSTATISSTGWSVTAGSLPPGLSLSAAGAITGTPTTAGSYSATVQATDSAGFTGTTVVSYTINNVVTVTNPGAQTKNSGTAIATLTLSASTSSSTATISSTGWSVTAGSLPPGLSLSAAGAITGTPTTAGSYSATVQATDSAGFTGTTVVSYTINNVVTVTNPGAQTSTAGTAISPLTLSASTSGASGGATISSWSLSGAPPGLSISPAGVVSGTPTTGGTYSVTATATDSAAFSGTSSSFLWTVHDVVTVTNPGAQTSTSGTAISTLTPSASIVGGGTVSSWAQTGMPPGLSFNASTGAFTGTPTTGSATPYSVTITATDSRGDSGSATFNWTVNNTVTVTNPGAQSKDSGTAIVTLTLSATTSSSTATISSTGWSVIAGSLPPGLSLSTAGAITGTPTTAGSYSATIQATDSAGFTGTTVVSYTINNVVTVTNPGTQSSVSGTAITPLPISATDSSTTATLAYSDSSTLPPGLSIDPSTGVISGTPTTAGVYPVTITATDGASYSGQASFTWTVTNTVTVTGQSNQSGVTGTSVSLANSATTSGSAGGAMIASWSATGLPAGLSIDSSTGTISGIPTTAGTSSVTVTATDSASFTGSTSFTWTLTNTVVVTAPSNQSNVSGTAVTPLTVSATDTSTTTSLSFTDSSSLPPGLSIDSSTGTITGTPTTAGIYAVTITATDGSGFVGTAGFTWTVTNTVSVTNPGNQTNNDSSAITPLQIVATDSSSGGLPLSYSDSGTLPAGLSIDPSTGIVSGTPTTVGVSSVTVTVTDSVTSGDGGPFVGSVSFTWTINEAPAFTSATAATFTAGVAGSFTVTATGTPAPSLTELGTLPGGVTFTDNGGGVGTLAGTPTTGTAGTYPITFTAASVAGSTPQYFTLTVATASSATGLTTSISPQSYLQPVTLTATVTGNSTLGSPTGTVTFTDTTSGSTVICSAASLAAASSTTSTATCSYTPPATGNLGGTFTVVATYNGDTSYSSSTSSTLSQAVLGNSQSGITLDWSPAGGTYSAVSGTTTEPCAPYNTPVTLVTSVYDTAHLVTPTGTVTFYDLTDNTTLCSGLAPSMSVTCTFTPTVSGGVGRVLSLEVAYSGDTHSALSYNHKSLTVMGTNSSTTTITSSPSSPVTGSQDTLYATVSGAQGTPTGTVSWTINGSPAACGVSGHTNLAGGTQFCKWTPVTSGTYTVTAAYSGDVTYVTPPTATTFTLFVNGNIATTVAPPTLTSPGTTPVSAGQPITVSAAVSAASGPTPTGQLNFSQTIGATTQAVSCGSPPTITAGVATCTFTPFAGATGGTVSVTASYPGSGTDAPSAASAALAVPYIGTASLSGFALTSNTAVEAGSYVLFTATLTGSAGTPGGSVSFYDASSASPSTPVTCAGGYHFTGGVATCYYIPPVAYGHSHVITASYSGDANLRGGHHPDGPHPAHRRHRGLQVATTSPGPTPIGTAVTLTTTVTGTTVAPAGTVSFTSTVAPGSATAIPAATHRLQPGHPGGCGLHLHLQLQPVGPEPRGGPECDHQRLLQRRHHLKGQGGRPHHPGDERHQHADRLLAHLEHGHGHGRQLRAVHGHAHR